MTARLLGLVDAGLVVLVLGVEARLEVVDERGRRRQQLAHHVAALQHHLRAPRAPGAPRRRGPPARGAPLAAAPLRDLALDVERAALGATAATRQTLALARGD